MGRYLWNKRTADAFQKAAEYFQTAIGKDQEMRCCVRRFGRLLSDGGT